MFGCGSNKRSASLFTPKSGVLPAFWIRSEQCRFVLIEIKRDERRNTTSLSTSNNNEYCRTGPVCLFPANIVPDATA